MSHHRTTGLSTLLLATLWLLAAHAGAQQPVLHLDSRMPESISLTEYFAVLEDPGNQLTLADVQSPTWATQFSSGQAPGTSLIFGLTRSAYWLRLHLHNADPQPLERMLEINYARLADVQLYYQLPGGTAMHWITGTNYPFMTRAYANRAFVFPLHLAAQSEQYLYLRVKGIAALEVPARLWQPQAFYAYERSDYVFHSIYYGMAMAMAIFNLLVFILLRERMYILYVFFVSSFALTLAAQNGLANEFLWPGAPFWSNYTLAIGYSYTLAALLLFTRSMLNTRQLIPRTDRVIQVIVALFLLSPLAFFYAYQSVIPFAMLLNVIASSLILAVGIYCAFKRQRSAYFFVAAFLVICTASPINSLRVAGLLPTNMFTVNGLQIGSAIEMILLAYALADRFNMIRREKELAQIDALQAQALLVENLQHSERQLEQQVAERTRELRRKNQELEALSTTDPLTGVFNRLKLSQRLDDEIERSKRYNSPLSLLMIDVDHFKHINDSYGHPAGDRVLADIAAQLRNHSRTNDAAGRWGGEEFLVICPATTSEGATALAETLRHSIASTGFSIADQVTVSIGIASFHADDSLAQLLERVDQALYQAKHEGRNCIRTQPIPAI